MPSGDTKVLDFNMFETENEYIRFRVFCHRGLTIRLKRTDHKFNLIIFCLFLLFSLRKTLKNNIFCFGILYQTQTTNIFVCKEQTIILLFPIVISFFSQFSWTKTFEKTTLSEKLKDKEKLSNRNGCMPKIAFLFFERLCLKNVKKNIRKMQEQKY